MLIQHLSTDYCAKGFTVFNRQNKIHMIIKVIQPFVGSGELTPGALNEQPVLIMLNISPALKLS